jgi:adenosylcobinamide-GDP ribazoletransferase
MRSWLAREVRLPIVALSFLTRLPVPSLKGFQEEWLALSAPWFPVVGSIVGLLAAAAWWLGTRLWTGPVPILLAVATAAWVTGGLHEDGWADVFDGFAASRDRTRILEVMKDSRIGAIGALALLLLLLIKVAALASLPADRVPAALVAAHVLSRWSSVSLMWGLPYARPEGGLGRSLVGKVTGGRLAAGTLLALLIAVGTLRRAAVPATATALVAVLLAALVFRRRLGGITGDCLGAANQLVEVGVFLALAARLP